MRTTTAKRLGALGAALALAATACGDDSGSAEPADDRDPEQVAPSTTTPVPLTDGRPGECMNVPGCDATVSPGTGLADGDVVRVRVTGWDPDGFVGIAQCADPAAPTTPAAPPGPDGLPGGDICNVLDLPGPAQTVRSDTDGVVDVDYEVFGGERMRDNSAAGVTCDAEHDCVLNPFVSGAGRFRDDAPRATFPLRFR